MMSKKKRIYCMASFAFACAVFIFTIILCWTRPEVVRAQGDIDPDSITEFTRDDAEDSETTLDEDTVDGLHITWNNDQGSVSTPIRMFLVLTILSLAPSILVMMTSYTRIIIVLHFLRVALGTQSSPPNQVMVGLALFLTAFIMWPTFTQINTNAIQPLDQGKITTERAIEEAQKPLREFMYRETQQKDLKLFVDLSGETYDSYDDIPFTTVVPAFILSEIRTAFIIGFLIYIPFIVIDMVVSSVLMSMGMMMLPPTTVSMPFKILLFVLADGWNLIIGSLLKTFQ